MQTIDFQHTVRAYQVILGNTRRPEFATNSALFDAIDPQIFKKFLPQKNLQPVCLLVQPLLMKGKLSTRIYMFLVPHSSCHL